MLTYDMSQREGIPKYLYLYQCIRDDILNGEIAPHEKIPSKRALAAHLNVSVITVENAYGLLQAEGYLYTKEKVGFFAENLPRRHAPQQKCPQSRAIAGTEHAYYTDFSSNKVQTSLYPASSMAKLTREALSLNEPKFLETVPYNGTAMFRNAIAEHLHRYRGMEVDPDQIIVGCGTEYLYSRLMQLFDERTVLGLEDPGNHKFADIAKRYRIDCTYLPIDDDGVRLDALAESRVNLVHLSPANSFPLGSVMPIRKRFDLLSWLYESDDRYLIEDDFDSEVNSYGNPTMPIFANDYNARTIYINSFAKTLVPSLRVSYIILPFSLLKRYRQTQTFYSCTVSGSNQYVLARFIEEGYFERHLNHLNTFFRAERALIEREIRDTGLGEYGEVSVPPAGTHVILSLGDKTVPTERMKANAESLDIRFASLADYSSQPTRETMRKLIVNYASVPPARLHEGLLRLKLCISHQSVAALP